MKRQVIAILCVVAGITNSMALGASQDVNLREVRFHSSANLTHFSVNYDWSSGDKQRKTNGIESVRTFSRDSVFSLAKELLELEEFRASRCWIEEYTIKDLDNDGKLEIIATLSEPCTSCPVQLLIIKNREDRFVLFDLDTVHASINDVVDLDSDGVFEVIIRHWVSGKAAMVNAVCWPKVLAWRENRYLERSREYPEYYKSYRESELALIREMETQLSIENSKTGKVDDENLQLIQGLKDAIKEHKSIVMQAEEIIAGRKKE